LRRVSFFFFFSRLGSALSFRATATVPHQHEGSLPIELLLRARRRFSENFRHDGLGFRLCVTRLLFPSPLLPIFFSTALSQAALSHWDLHRIPTTDPLDFGTQKRSLPFFSFPLRNGKILCPFFFGQTFRSCQKSLSTGGKLFFLLIIKILHGAGLRLPFALARCIPCMPVAANEEALFFLSPFPPKSL